MAEGGEEIDINEGTGLIDPIDPEPIDDREEIELVNMDERRSEVDRRRDRNLQKERGARPKTRTSTHSHINPLYEANEQLTAEESLAVGADLDSKIEDHRALNKIRVKYPNFKPDSSKFLLRINELGQTQVLLKRKNGVWRNFFGENGEIDSNQSDTIKRNLGLPVETVIEKTVNRIQKLKDKNREDRAQLDRVGISEGEKNELRERIETREEAVADGEQEVATLENRMKLKDRIKSIFKRHGFTVVSVVTAVGAIIGVIISNLKTGLAKMAKGVGNGLKDIGKKLAGILPGAIGAIASFIFKTAGEVVGFLAKNAWLLIIAVVIFVIDQFKKKNN